MAHPRQVMPPYDQTTTSPSTQHGTDSYTMLTQIAGIRLKTASEPGHLNGQPLQRSHHRAHLTDEILSKPQRPDIVCSMDSVADTRCVDFPVTKAIEIAASTGPHQHNDADLHSDAQTQKRMCNMVIVRTRRTTKPVVTNVSVPAQ